MGGILSQRNLTENCKKKKKPLRYILTPKWFLCGQRERGADVEPTIFFNNYNSKAVQQRLQSTTCSEQWFSTFTTPRYI